MEKVWSRAHEQKLDLNQLIAQIFPELAKLSPQGTVHATTLYSAANVVMRTPPGPLLAELVASGNYAPVGDNYCVLDNESCPDHYASSTQYEPYHRPLQGKSGGRCCVETRLDIAYPVSCLDTAGSGYRYGIVYISD